MGIRIYTETICQRCAKLDRREGAEGTLPPVGWASNNLMYRGEGDGWSNRTMHAAILCPECAAQVEAVVGGKGLTD